MLRRIECSAVTYVSEERSAAIFRVVNPYCQVLTLVCFRGYICHILSWTLHFVQLFCATFGKEKQLQTNTSVYVLCRLNSVFPLAHYKLVR